MRSNDSRPHWFDCLSGGSATLIAVSFEGNSFHAEIGLFEKNIKSDAVLELQSLDCKNKFQLVPPPSAIGLLGRAMFFNLTLKTSDF